MSIISKTYQKARFQQKNKYKEFKLTTKKFIAIKRQ